MLLEIKSSDRNISLLEMLEFEFIFSLKKLVKITCDDYLYVST